MTLNAVKNSFEATVSNALHWVHETIQNLTQYIVPTASERAHRVEEVAHPCIFCKQEVIERQQVWENRSFRILADYSPIREGHLLVMPKRDVRRIDELDDNESVDMMQAVKKAASFFKDVIGTEDYIMLQKNGRAAGQTVDHAHIHLIPIQHSWSNMLGQIQVLFKIIFGSRSIGMEELAKRVDSYKTYFMHEEPATSDNTPELSPEQYDELQDEIEDSEVAGYFVQSSPTSPLILTQADPEPKFEPGLEPEHENDSLRNHSPVLFS